MAQQTVSIGSSSNDGTGDPLRTAFTKVNENFTELYEKTGVDTTMTLQLSGNSLISTTTNTDIIIDPNGEGEIYLFGQEDFKISNSSRDSTTANHNITLSNEYADADIIFAVNTGSTTTEIARFDGSASALLVASDKQIQLGGTSTAISGNNSNITMTGNVTITGNLETAGTRTEISSTILDVEDNIIVLNKKNSGGSDVDAGIQIERGSAGGDALFYWNEGEDKFKAVLSTSGGDSSVNVTSVVDTSGATIVANIETHGSNNLTLADNLISTTSSNANINLRPHGTGKVVMDNLSIDGETGTISTDSSNQDITLTPHGTGTVVASSFQVGTGNDLLSLTTGTGGSGTTIATGSSNANITIAPHGTGQLNVNSAINIGTGNNQLTINDALITTNSSNADIRINPNGTGVLRTDGNMIADGTISAGVFTSLGGGGISVSEDGITTDASNADIFITPHGTGKIIMDTLSINGELGIIETTESNTPIQLLPHGTGTVQLDGVVVLNHNISSSSSNANLELASNGTGFVVAQSDLVLEAGFRQAVHTFTATDAITAAEHAGRILLLGEVGGNALVTLTLPDATGSGNMYEFIVTVQNTSNYVIKVPDADNTITGQIMYLDEDGTAVTSFPTVAASDTITINGGTTGGLVGDTLKLIDIAADKYAVQGTMRVASGADPATPFSATVS